MTKADTSELVATIIKEFRRADFMPPTGHHLWPLMQAIRQLAKAGENLGERLPQLVKGDKVMIDKQFLYRDKELPVIANYPEGRKLWLDDGGLGGALFDYDEISRIVPKEE